jgi:hypothetical protein
MLAVILAWPVAARLFQFGPLHGDDLLIVLGVGICMVLALEAAKWVGQTLMPHSADLTGKGQN